MHEIIIDCSEGTKVKATVKGYKGKGCHKLTEGLDAALGGKVKSSTNTAEYNEHEKQQQQTGDAR